jgi:hypothetical protein
MMGKGGGGEELCRYYVNDTTAGQWSSFLLK